MYSICVRRICNAYEFRLFWCQESIIRWILWLAAFSDLDQDDHRFIVSNAPVLLVPSVLEGIFCDFPSASKPHKSATDTLWVLVANSNRTEAHTEVVTSSLWEGPPFRPSKERQAWISQLAWILIAETKTEMTGTFLWERCSLAAPASKVPSQPARRT